MMPLFRSQVPLFPRLGCFSPQCAIAASYMYEDTDGGRVYACVRHDLFVRTHQLDLGTEVVNVSKG